MNTKAGFSTLAAARVTQLSPRQLQHWDETAFIQPSLRHGGRNRRYSFNDLVALRCANELRLAGISLQGLRHVAAFLADQDPPRTLANTWLISDGADVFIRDGDTMISALRERSQMTHVLFMLNVGAVEQEMRTAVAAMESQAA